jgi:putative membrane protein
MADETPQYKVEPSIGNHFAWLRTTMAFQRTQMAAVRTAVSLIGFGFTVAQFFEKLAGKDGIGLLAGRMNLPRDFGLLLIGAGVVSLIVFTSQFHFAMVSMHSDELKPIAPGAKSPQTSTYIISLAVILIGIAAFLGVFFRF